MPTLRTIRVRTYILRQTANVASAVIAAVVDRIDGPLSSSGKAAPGTKGIDCLAIKV